MSDTILIVDDETDLLRGLKRTIEMEIDARILLAENGADALSIIQTTDVDVVLTDVRMPEMDGMSLLTEIREAQPNITVIVMTAYGTIEKAVEAIKAGAYDFIQKPVDGSRLIHMLKNGLELNRLVRENERLTARLCEDEPLRRMVGNSRLRRKVSGQIRVLAQTDATVLILGETGTGKDLAACAIHELSSRRKKKLVTVNCPALPESILESELFGYEKGAFTGAAQKQKGLFDKADGGTIFLDEIGDLALTVQTKLLRVLEDKTIKPLGSSATHSVDVRIITATNQCLADKIRQNLFRQDLFYRLNVAVITMPPLRDVKEDIPLLVNHFLNKVAMEENRPPKTVSPGVMNYLCSRQWPGNIRELENTIRGWNALIPEDRITLEHVPEAAGYVDRRQEPMVDIGPYKPLKDRALEAFTIQYLNRLLEHTHGNVSAAAQISCIKRQSLQKIIRRYGVDVEKFRA